MVGGGEYGVYGHSNGVGKCGGGVEGSRGYSAGELHERQAGLELLAGYKSGLDV